MAWGREAVKTRAPGATDVAATPIVTEPGSIQFIPAKEEVTEIEGMIFACPSGLGVLNVLRFANVAEGQVGGEFYTWNRSVGYPGLVEEVYVARSGWRGFLRDGRWIGEVERQDNGENC